MNAQRRSAHPSRGGMRTCTTKGIRSTALSSTRKKDKSESQLPRRKQSRIVEQGSISPDIMSWAAAYAFVGFTIRDSDVYCIGFKDDIGSKIILPYNFTEDMKKLAQETIPGLAFALRAGRQSFSCTRKLREGRLKFQLIQTNNFENMCAFTWKHRAQFVPSTVADKNHTLVIEFLDYNKDAVSVSRGNKVQVHVVSEAQRHALADALDFITYSCIRTEERYTWRNIKKVKIDESRQENARQENASSLPSVFDRAEDLLVQNVAIVPLLHSSAYSSVSPSCSSGSVYPSATPSCCPTSPHVDSPDTIASDTDDMDINSPVFLDDKDIDDYFYKSTGYSLDSVVVKGSYPDLCV